MSTMKHSIRRLLAVPLALGLAVGVAACGSDDDATPASVADPAPDTTAAPPDTTAAAATSDDPEPVASTEPTDDSASTASAEFCDGFVELDMAFQAAPGDDPDAIGPYIETEITPRVEIVRSAVPAEVEDEVTVMIDAIEAVASTGDFSAFESPEFANASATIYPYLGNACDLAMLDVLALDYSYGGVPSTVDAGPTVVTLRNESESGEVHEMGFARVNDDVDLTVEELLAIPMEELEQSVEISGGVFALPGSSGGTILSLTPGRWVYVCFIPVGSVNGEEGTGPPHIAEGMYGELIVS